MGKYRRMTLDVRCQIKAYLQAGFSVAKISKELGYHKSSIYRELARNSSKKNYSPAIAEKLSLSRKKRC